MKSNNINEPTQGCCKNQPPLADEQPSCCQDQEIYDESTCCGGGCCQEAEAMDDSTHQAEGGCCAQAVDGDMQMQLSTSHEKYLRLYAEFDNFKRRTSKERAQLSMHAHEKMLQAFLSVLDDFHRGMAACNVEEKLDASQSALHEGIQLIYHKFVAVLRQFGVQEMKVQVGELFDGDRHEAIMRQPADQESMKGKVVAVAEKGYLFHEQVLRFAKVVIGV